MKKFAAPILVFAAMFLLACGCVLYVRRDSRPFIFCFFDDGVRAPNRCLMNPFRDRKLENIAENILEKLRNGETDSIVPYLTEDNRNRILQRENEFQITNWHIGEINRTEDKLSLKYWTSRRNYKGEEEVNFIFTRENDEWKLKYFSAVY
ncbi:MAG TPA: hypothetical protein VGC76_14880 [Pyrinomonadaceae bacterium]|jgi:hypothetical protein